MSDTPISGGGPGEGTTAAELMDNLLANLAGGGRRTPRQRGPACSYTLVHVDGTLGDFRGDRRDLIDHLNDTQDGAYSQGELGVEPLEDLPGIDAVWVGPYVLEGLEPNPVAAQMIQVFDFGEVPSICRGTVAFGPYLAQGGDLREHRHRLLLKIHAEIRAAHHQGEKLRKFLWPTEMITASRGLAPELAWEVFHKVRPQVLEGTRVTDFFREYERGRRTAERRGELAEYYED